MKKFLPQTNKNPQGFTLVELLVVIAIIAILAVIGTAVFSGMQLKARDAARRSDIEALSNAMEANYNSASASYQAVGSSMFASGTIPTGVGTISYTGVPAAATASYHICSVLEAGGSFCQDSQQR